MKSRVLSAMRQWATSIPKKSKIREAFEMLLEQGVRMPPDPQPVPQVPTGPDYLDAPAVILASTVRQSMSPQPSAASPVFAPAAAAPPASLLDFDALPAPSFQNPTFSHQGSLSGSRTGSQQDLASGGGGPASADPFDLGDLFAPKPKKDNGHYEDDRSLSSFAGSEWSMDPDGQNPVSAGRSATSTSFRTIPRALLSSMLPHTRRATCPTWRPCLSAAGWCLQSDAWPNSPVLTRACSRLQAHRGRGAGLDGRRDAQAAVG